MSVLSEGRPGRASLPGRLPKVLWALMAMTCAGGLGLGLALAQGPSPGAADGAAARGEPSGPPGAEQASARLREGTEITEQAGYFQVTGGRVVFASADGKRRFLVLENLCLERVARTIAQSPHALQWTVTGTVTEYRGANFLLLGRAVRPSGMATPGGGS